MADHYAAALRHLDAVEKATVSLQVEHSYSEPNKKLVATLYDEIHRNLGLAKVHATLSVGQRIADLGGQR